MHRTPLTRALAILMALWFAAYSAEPLVLHACPMHDGPLAHAAAAAAVPAVAAPHARAMEMHDAGQHGTGHSRHAGGHSCSCPGACCAAPGVAAPAGTQPLVVVAAVRPAPRAALPAALLRHRPSDPEHARPPSLGPPPDLHIG